MTILHQFLSLAAVAASLGVVQAKLDITSPSNVAVYWGQNSYGKGTGDLAQQPLAYYCQNTDIDVIPMAFLTMINGVGGAPEVDFANAGDNCTIFEGTNLKNCPQIAEDIKTCQSLGKTILLSIGGATYSEGGFSSESAAIAGANLIWETFGAPSSNSSVPRPFGDSVVDGFDFDFEATVNNMVPFGKQLRSLMDADTSKQYYLSSAPQCPFPDAYDKDVLNNVPLDVVWVQFYNNYCGVNSYVSGATTQNNFNFDTWDNWAKTSAPNKNVKIMLGVPANTGAGGGYEPVSTLAPVVSYSKTFSSFGGVMMWDASQAYANTGFISGVRSSLSSTSSRLRRRSRVFRS
ncbi:hypothetical protein ASPZODRAFT_1611365 [Penicilliopsis zonata CBS 506.65]|uniref:chitinase n=1 Tax=Penicilliopsis zonata CBS 506.65 TaxID=1073090 RepID=A0A1L9SN13_9EURO|nr:hypothetical protein ASPZODRAFT_1611365 [Penicilliopsis zonata CBS 506.65]OJJ48503.1 hypothetical protein ASPZODRAFT_1611365 [Penicilliopsis zonata CBS 506.65]